MVRWAVVLMKLVLSVGVVWLTVRLVQFIGYEFHYELASSFIRFLSAFIFIVSGCLGLGAIAAVNETNIRRVLLNWSILGVSTLIGWVLGGQMGANVQGSVHYIDAWYGSICGAVFMSAIGYIVTILRVTGVREEQDVVNSEDQLVGPERTAVGQY